MLLAWKERIKVFRLGCFSWTQEPFFVPCGAHTLNLVVAWAAKSSPDAIGYFGYLAKLFKLFSASPHRWDILLKYVKTTLKTWSGTRWESRIDSIHAVRYKAGQVREALLEVRETTTDPVVKVEAQSLAEEIGSYRFSICTVIWYDILCQIQHVSKLIQSPSIQIDVDLLLTCWKQRFRWQLQKYCVYKCTDNCKGNVWRDERGSSTQTKRLRTTKRQCGYEAPNEPVGDANQKYGEKKVLCSCGYSTFFTRWEISDPGGGKWQIWSAPQLSQHVQRRAARVLPNPEHSFKPWWTARY